MARASFAVVVALSIAACGNESGSAEEQALLGVKAFIQSNLEDLYAAAVALQAAAPAPDADGWNATADASAVANMKAAWKDARVAYEHVEGAIAVLFPELDVSTDERYDGFISTDPDDNLFDDVGATGVHMIERVLWSNEIPDRVRIFEEGLPGYKAAAFPANAAEAGDFKTKLCARLVDDFATMRDQFAPLALDPAAAYRGIIGSMNEQVEKTNLAATGEEESRYAQFTLADMRANVNAGLETYKAFRPWLLSKNGAAQDVAIDAAFDRLMTTYASVTGDALPPVPASWSSTSPSAADLATPFGQLYQVVSQEADPDREGSLVHAMSESADLLGIPQLPE